MQKRVLVVDDNPETVDLLKEALEKTGFAVSCASNGAECIKAVDNEQIDLVILDVYMPVLNGVDTLQMLRHMPSTKEVPAIILSGGGDYEDVRAGWAAGAEMYLTKPVKVGAVIAAVRWMLGTREEGEPIPSGIVASDL
jgi:DNA-binding response OmpR family regulator